MGKFVYFTSAEKRQANEVDLPSFLLDRGEKLIMAGRDYRLASDHSITVRGPMWYDHAARKGGRAISFVQQFYDKTYPEAVTKLLGRDGIVAIGGDGTFRGAQELSKCGVSVVGIPGTIDNDIVCTEYTIGFDTAANTAVECIDKLRDTMQSHERCAVVEVMGRHAGYLALYVGVAVGATAVLVPERPYDFHSQVAEKIRHARLNGKTNFMIVVAEGAASAVDVGRQIQEELALDPRVTILGHIQRGGSPTAKDRVMATRMGYEAVRILAEGKTNRVICTKDDQIIDLDIDEGLAMKKTLNSEEFKVMTVMTGM